MTTAKFVKSLVIGLSCFSSLAVVHASDSVDAFEKKKASMLSSFESSKKENVDKFEQSKTSYLSAFNKAKEKLSKTWDIPELTNKSKWVQYSNNDQVKRSVDFETGSVVVEVVGNDLSEEQINKIIKGQVSELENQTTTNAYTKDSVLAATKIKPNKIESKAKVLPDVSSKELLMAQTKSSYTQKNGLKVTRVSMAVPQNKVAKRAMIYLPHVSKTSEKWGVEPELILAIMHTESHFNPMAQSHIPAYGLMQVVPTSAGRDVTKIYLGKEQLLSPEILFNPEFNIDIGTAYLNILDTRYLKRVDNKQSRMYLSIISYNGGIGAAAKVINGNRNSKLSSLAVNANKLTPDEIYHKLSKGHPAKEARDYLKKVNDKREYYAKVLNTGSM